MTQMTTPNMARTSLATLILIGLLAGCSGAPDPSMELGGINTGEVLAGLLARTERAIGKINSVDSAKLVKVELQRINEDYDDLLYHIPKLSPEGRQAIAHESAQALPGMKAMVNQIHEMPALDEILGETLDQMVEKLERVW